MARTEAFEKYHDQYDEWFEKNELLYEAELLAVKELLPKDKKGLEIGIGSGIFAIPLGIKEGVDPSKEMTKKAIEKGLKVIEGIAENLPIEDNSFDFTLMVTSICFVDDPLKSFQEALRVVKKGGSILVGFVDKESEIGKRYLKMKDSSKFYQEATFYSTDELLILLDHAGFKNIEIRQTLLSKKSEKDDLKVKEGYGEGSFVVIKGYK